LKQTITPFELIVGDDASTDQTLAIIKKYSAKANFPVLIQQNQQRLGVVENFSQTLARCRGQYIALCDQDDYWLPDKLAGDLCLLKEAEAASAPGLPILTHSDPLVFSANSKLEPYSFMKLRKIRHFATNTFEHLLAQNFVTGCTATLNRHLLESALPIPTQAIMHDWWLALVAAARGRVIFAENRHTVYYRRHANNLIGAKPLLTPALFERLRKTGNLKKEHFLVLEQNRALLKHLQTMPASQTTATLSAYLDAANRGGLTAVTRAIKLGIKKNGWYRNLFFYYNLLNKQL